ncbi:hypothetical protein B566_EDAN018195 [Ephemera danica]|nr:hypothetical protein B566_EDAN018195 [Ephemera danica]
MIVEWMNRHRNIFYIGLFETKRASTPGSPASSPLKSPNKPQGLRSASLTPEPSAERKKLPMNKIQVGTAASPNLKTVRSKIGSLDNATHKPGGGQVRIESRKVDFSKAGSRIAAKNDQYQPGGGDKKIESKKLQWNAKSKIGSLENTTHKPGGGDKKIESQKLEFKDKAKSKVGSKDNIKHSPGGGNVKSGDTPPSTQQQAAEPVSNNHHPNNLQQQQQQHPIQQHQ